MVRDPETMHELVVEHTHTAGRERAHRELLVSGDAQLAHDKNVEGSAKRACDFICDRYATTRQRQHKQVRAVGVSRELGGEHPASLAAIAKEPWCIEV
jgi:hypothetical protein